jgi:16S rRNA (guanine527-N7)-methyltransferase
VNTPEEWAFLAARRPGLDWARLEKYVCELEHWNRAIRLVGPKDAAGIRLQVTDALLPFLFYPPAFPLLDIGSGAGLPGLVVALAFPALWGKGPVESAPRVICLEPQGKRVSFLRHAVRHLGLKGVEIVGQRAETALKGRGDLRRSFSVVTARAVAAAGELLDLAEPYLAEGGRVVLPRGDESPVFATGWRLSREIPYEGPPGFGPRRVHVYEREGLHLSGSVV